MVLEKQAFKISGLALCRWHFKFFALGFLLGEYKTCFRKYLKKLFWAAGLVFVVLVPFWTRIGIPEIPFASNLFLHNAFALEFFNTLVAICGSYAVSYIISCISDISKVKHFLAYIGQHTIEIYILSNYFIGSYFTEKIVNYVISFLLAIGGPVIIKKVLDYIPYASYLLFGDNRKRAYRNYSG